MTPAELVSRLRVEPEPPRSGYDRDLFEHWVDDDGDGCDTRDDVLTAESTTVPGRCAATGTWVSLYDGLVFTDRSQVQIDHVVALAEAWDSGASSWDAARRRAFANDVTHPETLRAVSGSSNGSKSDRDPAQWLPPDESAFCVFATDWVSVKLTWDLSADPAEVAALERITVRCPPVTSPTTESSPGAAPDVPSSTDAPSSPTSLSPAPPPSTPPSVVPPAVFPNCAAARAAGAAPLRVGDPGFQPRLDRDGDGVACE